MDESRKLLDVSYAFLRRLLYWPRPLSRHAGGPGEVGAEGKDAAVCFIRADLQRLAIAPAAEASGY